MNYIFVLFNHTEVYHKAFNFGARDEDRRVNNSVPFTLTVGDRRIVIDSRPDGALCRILGRMKTIQMH